MNKTVRNTVKWLQRRRARFALQRSTNAHYAIPTTVAPYDGGVLVIANSQVDLIERFKEDPKSTMAQLQPTVVLKIDATAIH